MNFLLSLIICILGIIHIVVANNWIIGILLIILGTGLMTYEENRK